MRIDKFLWAVRLFKTRSLATEACKAGKILINDQTLKPSREVKEGEEIKVKKIPIWRTYRVKALLKSRVGAKLVGDYIEETTPEEEVKKLELHKLAEQFDRTKGTGRPTKKERRDIEKYFK